MTDDNLAVNEANMERSWDDPPTTFSRKRGRKSADSLTALAVVAPDVRLQRPEPPARLSAEEQAIWREIVVKVKPGWFWSSELLLEVYCRCVAQERTLAAWAKEIDRDDPRYLELMRMHRAEAMLCANLAGKLRLTPRSTVDRYALKLAPPGPRPWDPPAA